jgi:hypothetical protein
MTSRASRAWDSKAIVVMLALAADVSHDEPSARCAGTPRWVRHAVRDKTDSAASSRAIRASAQTSGRVGRVPFRA